MKKKKVRNLKKKDREISELENPKKLRFLGISMLSRPPFIYSVWFLGLSWFKSWC
jgi:hypothetical protein